MWFHAIAKSDNVVPTWHAIKASTTAVVSTTSTNNGGSTGTVALQDLWTRAQLYVCKALTHACQYRQT